MDRKAVRADVVKSVKNIAAVPMRSDGDTDCSGGADWEVGGLRTQFRRGIERLIVIFSLSRIFSFQR